MHYSATAGLSGKPVGTASVAGPATSKQVKSAKAAQKKDIPQAAGSVASEKKTERPPERERKKDAPHPRMQFDDVHKVEKAKKRAVVNQSEARNRVELFRHLPQYVHGTQLPDLESKFFQLDPMHPSVYKVIVAFELPDIYEYVIKISYSRSQVRLIDDFLFTHINLQAFGIWSRIRCRKLSK